MYVTRELPQELKLYSGSHDRGRTKLPKEGCAMEWASWLANEPWSYKPQCVSRAIAAFMVNWNDNLGDEARQMLVPFIPRVLGTATTEAAEEKRAWMATDWLARTFAPAWLDLAGLTDHAKALRELPELSSDELANQSIEIIKAACSAAWSAACSAARSAACSAAWSAACSAARSAACSAARSAACSAAWSAAESAAGEAIAPTAKILQASALDLLERMIGVTA